MMTRTFSHVRHDSKGNRFTLYKIISEDGSLTYETELQPDGSDQIQLFKFPNDPKMPWLSDLVNSDIMAGYLGCESTFSSRALSTSTSTSPSPSASTTTNTSPSPSTSPSASTSQSKLTIIPLAYTPQMRATFLYSFSGKEWIGKTDANASKSNNFLATNYQILRSSLTGNHLKLPKMVQVLANPPLILYEKVSGVPLGSVVDQLSSIIDQSIFEKIINNVANSLRELHSLNLQNLKMLKNQLKTRTLEKEVRSLNSACDVLIKIFPLMSSEVNPLRERFTHVLEKHYAPKSLIHGDFHHSNILVDGTNVTVIDTDEIAFGDPALDVGRFLSSLRFPFYRTFGSIESFNPYREVFLNHYRSNNNLYDNKNISLFEAISLLTSAASAYRFQSNKWKEVIPLLIKEANLMSS